MPSKLALDGWPGTGVIAGKVGILICLRHRREKCENKDMLHIPSFKDELLVVFLPNESPQIARPKSTVAPQANSTATAAPAPGSQTPHISRYAPASPKSDPNSCLVWLEGLRGGLGLCLVTILGHAQLAIQVQM